MTRGEHQRDDGANLPCGRPVGQGRPGLVAEWAMIRDAVTAALANFFPGSFSLVMATGIVSIAAHLLGLAAAHGDPLNGSQT